MLSECGPRINPPSVALYVLYEKVANGENTEHADLTRALSEGIINPREVQIILELRVHVRNLARVTAERNPITLDEVDMEEMLLRARSSLGDRYEHGPEAYAIIINGILDRIAPFSQQEPES